MLLVYSYTVAEFLSAGVFCYLCLRKTHTLSLSLSFSLSLPLCPFCVYLPALCLRFPGSSFLKTNLLMSWLYCKIKKNKFCLFLSQNPIQNCNSKFYQERGKTKTNLLLCGRMESKWRRMHHTYVLYHLISKSD